MLDMNDQNLILCDCIEFRLQFIPKVCGQMKSHIKPGAIAISLIKVNITTGIPSRNAYTTLFYPPCPVRSMNAVTCKMHSYKGLGCIRACLSCIRVKIVSRCGSSLFCCSV